MAAGDQVHLLQVRPSKPAKDPATAATSAADPRNVVTELPGAATRSSSGAGLSRGSGRLKADSSFYILANEGVDGPRIGPCSGARDGHEAEG